MGMVAEWWEEIKFFATENAGDDQAQKENFWRTFPELLVSLAESESCDLTDYESTILLSAARRCATKSVADNNSTRLRYGMAAIILENCAGDVRRTLLELTLLDNSARKLGSSLESIYEEFRSITKPQIQSIIDGYLSEGDRRIEAMHYVESVDKNGEFTYVQTR